MRATGKHQRTKPCADQGTGEEADERERPDDEPLEIAIEREQCTEGDDQPIDRCHAAETRAGRQAAIPVLPIGRTIFYRTR